MLRLEWPRDRVCIPALFGSARLVSMEREQNRHPVVDREL